MEAVSFDNLSTQNLLPQVEADGPGKKKAAKEKAESSINIGKALQKEKDKQVEEAKVRVSCTFNHIPDAFVRAANKAK